MSAESTAPVAAPNEYRITSGPWASAWKIAAAVGVLGLGAALIGRSSDVHRFAYSYLFGFIYFVTIALGAMFFILFQHLTSAGWSVVVRRIAECLAAGVPIFALLFLPVAAGMGDLYPWTHTESSPTSIATESNSPASQATSEGHAEPDARVGSLDRARQIDEHNEADTLRGKAPYLNTNFFYLRALFYFLAWSGIALTYFRNSTRQDTSKDRGLTVTAQKLAPVSTLVLALTLTFASFDWLMSLNPFWYSTIFGVWIFSGAIVSTHALITLIALGLRSTGVSGRAITVEHFHDLGKLTFGFNVFWAYISFSQYFLIWYASIPEETVFFHARWSNGPWVAVSLLLFFGHFVIPFALLMSRNVKRRLPYLALGCAILVGMHIVEAYWIVLPMYSVNVLHLSPALPTALSFHWLDIACFLGIGGIYFALVFFRMAKHPVLPIGDPRLDRSIRFENA